MRFWTLVRTNLRECIYCIGVTFIAFLTIGFYILRMSAYTFNGQFTGGYSSRYSLFWDSPLSSVGGLLFFLCLAFGIVLGLVQFADDSAHPRRPWHFILHRSVAKKTVLLARLTTAAIAFVLSFGVSWTIFYLAARLGHLFLIPPTGRVFVEGWLLIAFGYVVYLAAAMAAMGQRWNTGAQHVVSIPSLLLAGVAVFTPLRLVWVGTVIVAAVVIYASQLFYVFLNKEF